MNKKKSLVVAQKLSHAYDLFNQGLLNNAEKLALQIFKKNSTEPYVYNLLGIIKLRANDLESAIFYLKKAVKLKSNPELLTNLALAYHEAGALDKAFYLYTEALKIEPKDTNALFNQHAIFLDRGNIEEAISNLEKILSYQPSDYETIYMLMHVKKIYKDEAMPEYQSLLLQTNSLCQSRLRSFMYMTELKPTPKLLGSGFEVLKNACKAITVKEGLVLEFGVRHGTSIRQLANLISKPIYGFDSFEGLPEDWHQEPKEVYSTHGKIPKVPSHVTLIQGWFDQTLPIFLEKYPQDVGLINIDCDIYISTKSIFDLLGSRIKSGTILIFDEYIGNEYWEEDEHKAFIESTLKYQWQYEYLYYSAFTKQAVVRII